MTVITSNIRLDLIQPDQTPVVHAVQGEYAARCVELSLFCDGLPWQIPTDTTPAIRYGRVDFTGGYYDTLPDGTPACSISGNTLSILLAPQMTACAGTVSIQAELLRKDSLLATFSFYLTVAANPAAEIVKPESYINWSQWMVERLEEQTREMALSGEFTGPAGPPAAVTGYHVVYQASASGNSIPQDNWSSTIPSVPAGAFLWTRTTVIFNQTSEVIFYSVARAGLDGAGSVSSVANISPDANGNIPLTASDIGALARTGGDLTGELKMNGQPISGLNMPVANDQAANMDFVNQQVRKAAPGNLLDNSDFTNPVNQRGNSAYTGTAGYSIDRWTRTSGLNVTVGSGKIVLTNVKTDDFYSFHQKFEPGKIVSGKTYTFAVKTVDGTVYTGVVVAPESSDVYTDIPIGTSAFLRMVLGSDGLYNFRIGVHISNTLELVWAALYEGEYTAETLPEYHPKGYGAELRECQRYFVKMTDAQSGYGHISSTTNIWVVLFVPCTMRTTPTITFGGTIGIYAAGKNYINFTPTGTVGHKGNMIRFSASRESTSELPEKEPLTAYWSEPMTFSADL